MLFLSHVFFILKQLIRAKAALFFTLIFPVLLYVFYGHAERSMSIIVFFNFSIQSAMLQSVGIFASAQKHSSWGRYTSTLPVPTFYPALAIISAMWIIGMSGLAIIAALDLAWFHTLSCSSVIIALAAAAIGAIPMGALGYLLGISLDLMAARNGLVLINMLFLFINFVPEKLNQILAWFSLPNAWLVFSMDLVLMHHINEVALIVLLLYSVLLLFVIQRMRMSYR